MKTDQNVDHRITSAMDSSRGNTTKKKLWQQQHNALGFLKCIQNSDVNWGLDGT